MVVPRAEHFIERELVHVDVSAWIQFVIICLCLVQHLLAGDEDHETGIERNRPLTVLVGIFIFPNDAVEDAMDELPL